MRFTHDGFLETGVTWSGPVSGSLSRRFDANFRMTSQTINGAAISLVYDADGLLTAAGALGLTLDPQNGRVTSTVLASLTDSYGYDASGLFLSYTAMYGGNALYAESVVRDIAGRITQKTETLQGTTHVWGYVFDAAGRLADVSEDGNFFSHYAYDADDNRTPTKDPSQFRDGTNLYTYAFNDPVNNYDLDGHFASVTQTGNNVGITIPIYFYGPGSDDMQNVQNVVNKIQNSWTGQFGQYNVTTTIRVYRDDPNDFSSGSACPVSPIPINRVQLMTPTGQMESNTFPYGFNGQWDTLSPYDSTFAHETSHLLGLEDQYTNKNDITYGWANSRASDAAPTGNDIARAIHGNSWGIEW